jgi:hypothetical protein
LIRKIINGKIGGPPLSKDMFYTSWKKGGLGLKNLREIFCVKFHNFPHFFLRDDETTHFAKWLLGKEAGWEKITPNPASKS